MKIEAIRFYSIQPVRKPSLYFKNATDSFVASSFDESILRKRNILKTDLTTFFTDISSKIFENKKEQQDFFNLLNNQYISLSSSCYTDLNDPASAVAVELEPDNSTAKNLSLLDDKIRRGKGVGINFSMFENPTDEIKKINQFFKYKEDKVLRPPAGIALLDINHPKIMDFIQLKDNEDFLNWCFDLSVVVDDDFMNRVKNKEKSALAIYNQLLKSMLKKGEPGIIFSTNKNYICDSCACKELKANEELVLGHVNLAKFYNNGKFDYEKLKFSTKFLSKAMEKISPDYSIGVVGYQDLLTKMNLKYGSDDALKLLENIIKTIKQNAKSIAIAPSGTTSRLLKTTPSIEPKEETTYLDELKTMAIIQKQIDGQISKTVNLKSSATFDDIDYIVQNAYSMGLKGITVFPLATKNI